MRLRNGKYPFEACATGNTCFLLFPFRVRNDKHLFEACATGCYPLRRHATEEACFPFFVESNNVVNAMQMC